VTESGAASRGLRIDHGVTSGTFSLDGRTWDVDNNVWVIGDDHECLVIDAPHDADAIAAIVAGRRLLAIACTHAHDDHVRVAPELADRLHAPILLHPHDLPLWELTHPDRSPDSDLADGMKLSVGGAHLEVVHTPGHSPGSVCFRIADLGLVFSGDTLFKGGPGATGRSFSDFPTIIDSIQYRLLTLPADTVVRPGHGDETTIGAEAPHLQEWIDRGH
jgi:glyoxylase-like metal-dependent hydrolase (beta-lactamase superfamily II)